MDKTNINHACGEFIRFLQREKDLAKCKKHHRLLIERLPERHRRWSLLQALKKRNKIWFQEEVEKEEGIFMSELLNDSDNLDLINEIAQFYRLYVRDYEKAVVFNEKIFLIDPTFFAVALRLAQCYENLNQYEKGIFVFDTYIKAVEDQKYIDKQLLPIKYKKDKEARLRDILEEKKHHYRYRGHLKFKLDDLGYIKDYLMSSDLSSSTIKRIMSSISV